jgi:glycerophosphoryl diester phosphodiesterase
MLELGRTAGAAALLVVYTAASEAQVTAKPESFDLEGHRGTRGLRPENTLPAFAHALSIGVSTLELDCGVTKDGVVVISHDPELNPDITRDQTGEWIKAKGPAFFALTYAEVQHYDVGRIRPGSAYASRFPEQRSVDGTRVPRLSELFALVKKSGNPSVRFNIETKIDPTRPALTLPPEAFAEALVHAIRDAGMARRAMIQSFDWRTLRVVQKIAPELETVCLTSQSPGDDTIQAGREGRSPWLAGLDVDDYGGSVPRLVKAADARVWSPNAADLNAARVAEAHALGLRVVPWTVNDEKQMAALIDVGVDGLISDRPDQLRGVLQRKGVAVPRPTPVAP